MGRNSGQSRWRQFALVAAGCSLMLSPALIASCAQSTRYRVLSFFFDGVPKPGEEAKPEGYVPGGTRGAARPFNPRRTLPPPEKMLYVHEPVALGKCDSCHDSVSKELILPIADGFCQTCHTDIPGDALYVHGPVAVNACDFCHKRHGSALPALLLEEADALCYSCHDEDEITEGDFHAELETRSCIDCHDPHMGDNQYFVKQDDD